MLYVFVEGPDDEKFINKVMSSSIGKYRVVRYSVMSTSKINDYIQTIRYSIPDADYIFLGDADGRSLEDAKQHLLDKYYRLSSENVYIVQFEIESWYYAGLSESDARKLKMKHYTSQTDDLTKESFRQKMQNKSDRKYIMASILEVYSLSLGVTRNKSLSIFTDAIKERTPNAVY